MKFVESRRYKNIALKFWGWWYSKWLFTNYVDKILDFFDHLLPCVVIFYGIYVNVDHLPTLYCKRSLWTPPNWKFCNMQSCGIFRPYLKTSLKLRTWRLGKSKRGHWEYLLFVHDVLQRLPTGVQNLPVTRCRAFKSLDLTLSMPRIHSLRAQQLPARKYLCTYFITWFTRIFENFPTLMGGFYALISLALRVRYF